MIFKAGAAAGDRFAMNVGLMRPEAYNGEKRIYIMNYLMVSQGGPGNPIIPNEPVIPEPTDPMPTDPNPDPYPVTDPIPDPPHPNPSPEPTPFPTPPEPIPQYPPDVTFQG